ncbi:MAG TPA: ATP-binding cassette domain-containing protein, partial [Baekduia sp.]|nr:ATP-binding cassette domain-containing protein [Baekduia sp.]
MCAAPTGRGAHIERQERFEEQVCGIARPIRRRDGQAHVAAGFVECEGQECATFGLLPHQLVDPVPHHRGVAQFEGRIVALLGANGAGKSTTLKAISNLLAAERGDVTKGTIEFKGA